MTIRIEHDIDCDVPVDSLSEVLREMAEEIESDDMAVAEALTQLADGVEGSRPAPSGVRGALTLDTPTEPGGELTPTGATLIDAVEMIRKHITDAAGARGRLVELHLSVVVDVEVAALMNERWAVDGGHARRITEAAPGASAPAPTPPADLSTVRGIYQFHLDCGRQGSLTGVFSATPADISKIVGREVCFGEVLGKHSDVSAVLNDDNFTLASNAPEAVALFESLDLATGTNPLNYLDE